MLWEGRWTSLKFRMASGLGGSLASQVTVLAAPVSGSGLRLSMVSSAVKLVSRIGAPVQTVHESKGESMKKAKKTTKGIPQAKLIKDADLKSVSGGLGDKMSVKIKPE